MKRRAGGKGALVKTSRFSAKGGFVSQPIERDQLDTGLADVLAWYEALEREMTLPHRVAVTPEALKRFLGSVNIIQVEHGHEQPARFRIRLMGTKIRDAHGEELTGQYIDTLQPPEYRNLIVNAYNDVVASARWRADFIQLQHRDRLGRYVRIVLPFCEDDPGRVDILVTVAALNDAYLRVYMERLTEGDPT